MKHSQQKPTLLALVARILGIPTPTNTQRQGGTGIYPQVFARNYIRKISLRRDRNAEDEVNKELAGEA